MSIDFATCERHRALAFIKQVYPSKEITDTAESAGPLLDFVEKDIVRIQDPMMYGNMIAINPGKNWIEDEATRAEIIKAAKIFA